MIIDNLASLPSAVTAGDELPIERGTTTYKIDYGALATAILAAAIKPGDVVNNLTSTVTDKPLSAAQGKALNTLITGIGKNETLLDTYTTGEQALAHSYTDYRFLILVMFSGSSDIYTAMIQSNVMLGAGYRLCVTDGSNHAKVKFKDANTADVISNPNRLLIAGIK